MQAVSPASVLMVAFTFIDVPNRFEGGSRTVWADVSAAVEEDN